MSRTKHKLTVAKTKSDKLRPGLYGDGGGLYLQVSDRRTKAWVYRYMIAGRARKMGLGDFDRVTLAEARDAAHEAYLLTRDGRDPIAERNARKAAIKAEREALTFKQAAEQLIAMKSAGWKHAGKSAGQWRASLKTYAYPVFGDEPVAAIDQAMVMKVLTPIWETKTETAARVRNRIENVLDWAKACGHRQGDNPAAWAGNLQYRLAAPEKVKPVQHFPALPYAELPDFMADLRQREGVSARALEFLILTVARSGNVMTAKWSEINLADRLWTMPRESMKGEKGKRKRDHVVPLCDRALAILNDLPREGEFVFPGSTAKRGISNGAMPAVLDRMNADRKAVGLSAWIDPTTGREAVPHGFRSTFKDWATEKTDYASEAQEIAMAHTVSNKVEAAYRRGDMRDKRRLLMRDWANYCESGNVVAFKGAQR
jgi:integrase